MNDREFLRVYNRLRGGKLDHATYLMKFNVDVMVVGAVKSPWSMPFGNLGAMKRANMPARINDDARNSTSVR